ncbi:MAG: methyl-accepting chemotaxis protein [Oscillospiraceae bacterium]|nr:methyl-accepting chemotaxis protein [Oscillospiraceae bacterium]
MKNLKVSMKLIISFVIVIVLAIAVGAIGIYGMSAINRADEALYHENVVALSAMANIRETLQNQIVLVRNLALHAGDVEKLNEIQNELASLEIEMQEYFKEYEACITDNEAEYAYFEGKNLYLSSFAETKRRVIQASHESLSEARSIIFESHVAETRSRMVEDFDSSMQYNNQWAKDTVNRNDRLFANMRNIQIVVLTLSIAIAMFFAFYISGMISKLLVPMSAFFVKAGTTGDIFVTPEDEMVIGNYIQNKDELGRLTTGVVGFIERLNSVSSVLETVASGDLTVSLEPLSNNDILGLSLEKMTNNLNNMFADIQTSTRQVSTGSKQVADGAQSLAQGSTEQAASIQQLSSSISEISTRTSENAKIAERTSTLSNTIKGNAEKGSIQMDEMISAVKDINEASQSISKIIKTIDDIAFQTNILALNAAVEAARAGQHGKGFAVVAEEVRNLASKSADAAKDTGNMIQNSMEKAILGSQIAEETAHSLEEIVTGINESSMLIDEIARASEEQSLSISQINIGIDQVAQVVQQNSATAQESAAASEEMSSQSQMLSQLISQFRLKESDIGNRSFELISHAVYNRNGTSTGGDEGYQSSNVINFGKY